MKATSGGTPLSKLPRHYRIAIKLRAFLEHHPDASVLQLRYMVGMAAKYILPPSDWDYRGSVKIRTRLNQNLAGHPIVGAIIDGFTSVDSKKLESVGPLQTTLQDMAGYDKPLRSRRLRPRLRKRRMTRYRKEAVKVLVLLRELAHLDPDAPAGIRVSIESIKSQFLP